MSGRPLSRTTLCMVSSSVVISCQCVGHHGFAVHRAPSSAAMVYASWKSSDVLLGCLRSTHHVATAHCASHCHHTSQLLIARRGREDCVPQNQKASSVETCFMYFISFPRKHGPYRVFITFTFVAHAHAKTQTAIHHKETWKQPQIGAKSALVIAAARAKRVCTCFSS